MNNQHLLIIWEPGMELPNGPKLYEEKTLHTIHYLLNHCGNPKIMGGWTDPDGAAATIFEFLADFREFLKTTTNAFDPQVIVCSAADGLILAMDTKNPVIFYPLQPMTIEEVEKVILRGALLHRHDSLTKEMEECLSLLHRSEGVETIAGINELRQATTEFFDRTEIRWGQHRSEFGDPECFGKAVA